MSSLYCNRCLRMRTIMRSPPPTAVTMRVRRMIDAMTCIELPAAAMGLQSRSVEALSLDDEAEATLRIPA